ncbi:hypothetical protein F5051DRAFT_447431 [Lentinula edodes]|nr:hypothetical protein F5051DRAFT_447431 [Lentinula edodes]
MSSLVLVSCQLEDLSTIVDCGENKPKNHQSIPVNKSSRPCFPFTLTHQALVRFLLTLVVFLLVNHYLLAYLHDSYFRVPDLRQLSSTSSMSLPSPEVI